MISYVIIVSFFFVCVCVGATICNYCRAMALFAAAATHGNADMCSRLFWIVLADLICFLVFQIFQSGLVDICDPLSNVELRVRLENRPTPESEQSLAESESYIELK